MHATHSFIPFDPVQLQFGLVDASSDSDLDEKLDQLEKEWNDLQIPFNFPHKFHSWFKAYSREVIVKSMLRPVREKAGLGCPPSPYYTNDVESKNNILKQHLCHKPSALPDFVDSMKAMITIQQMIPCDDSVDNAPSDKLINFNFKDKKSVHLRYIHMLYYVIV